MLICASPERRRRSLESIIYVCATCELHTGYPIKKIHMVFLLHGRTDCFRARTRKLGAALKSREAELSQTQRKRLAFLELRAYFTGELRRGDIESRFGIKPAAASRDLSIYREIAPGNLAYDS